MPTINIYNCDCQELLNKAPDGHYDIAIVDPDYGLNEKISSGGTWASKYKSEDGFLSGKPDKKYFDELFRVSKNQIVWGGNYFELPPTRGFIIWDKISRLDTLSDCEYAWTSFNRNAKIFKHARNTSEKRIHITQKPVKLYRWIFHNYAKQGDKVLDTHGGSMSIIIAAIDYGFDIDICEIDKIKFEKAKKRILNYACQLNMFSEKLEINFNYGI